MKYRSKRVKILAENCLSGVLTCDKDGNIFKKGKKANEHIDYDGYRAIYVDGVQIPCHQIIAYLKFKNEAIQEGIVTRHLNSKQLDNSWDNIGIGTPKDNVWDIPPEVRSMAAIKRWRSKTLEERRAITQKSADNTSKDKRLKRSLEGGKFMSYAQRSKAYQSRYIEVPEEIINQINYLKDEYTLNDLSRFFDLPVSKIHQVLGI